MKKMLRLRNYLIAILCFTIICMSIGFSILSVKLENTNENKPYFNVVFSKVVKETAVKGETIEPRCTNSITNSSKEVNLNCNLNAPHDELSYIITIKNEGNMDATIVGLKENISYEEANTTAQIKHTDVEDKILKPEEEITLKVYINYGKDTSIKPKNLKYNLFLITSSPSK